jgi:hypothetical protein
MRRTSMSSAGFEPAIPAIEHLQTYALDRTATGIGVRIIYMSFRHEIVNIVTARNFKQFEQ